jgi:hypothetical protein
MLAYAEVWVFVFLELALGYYRGKTEFQSKNWYIHIKKQGLKEK